MLKYKEFNTWLIIEQVKKEMPSIRFSIPKVNAKIQLLENYYFESKDQLNENKWGIQEPLFGDKTMAEEIDLVIVPLLAFDKSGHRVGYGKGYYDKLLSTCRPNTLKIGVSLFQPVENIEDTNNLDVALDFCVTPEKIISFT
jgi:5-formyltetrahydrofolate cyclo-ligase